MDYPVVIRPLTEDEGGGYLAVFPDLPGCMSDGETPQEALDNAKAALEEWMDTARGREGFVIPKPGERAAIVHRERIAIRDALGSLAQKYDDLDGELADLRTRVEEVEEMMEHKLAWSRFEALTGGSAVSIRTIERRLLSHQ